MIWFMNHDVLRPEFQFDPEWSFPQSLHRSLLFPPPSKILPVECDHVNVSQLVSSLKYVLIVLYQSAL